MGPWGTREVGFSAAMSDPETSRTTSQDPRILLSLTVLLLVILVAAVLDLVLDRPRTLWSAHVLLEVLVVLACAGGVVVLGLGWARARGSLRRLHGALRRNEEELAAWRARAASLQEGLGRAIDEQLAAWSLTATEREVARLILEGYSHKEIAAATARSDRTVRQHAAAVYRKSGLAGRAELSAFFLEGLLDGGGRPG